MSTGGKGKGGGQKPVTVEFEFGNPVKLSDTEIQIPVTLRTRSDDKPKGGWGINEVLINGKLDYQDLQTDPSGELSIVVTMPKDAKLLSLQVVYFNGKVVCRTPKTFSVPSLKKKAAEIIIETFQQPEPNTYALMAFCKNDKGDGIEGLEVEIVQFGIASAIGNDKRKMRPPYKLMTDSNGRGSCIITTSNKQHELIIVVGSVTAKKRIYYS